jgi:tripartite-type tricarboxylate transporter receptor subunit TctC
MERKQGAVFNERRRAGTADAQARNPIYAEGVMRKEKRGFARFGRCLGTVVGLALCSQLLPAGVARAEEAGDFYHGRTIELVVSSGAGGGYDLNARLLARHMGRFVPGDPTIVVNNMPGAGGIRASNYLYNVAPRDGSVIATFSNAMITEPLLGTEAVKFDPAKLSWIGSITSEDATCVAWKTAAVKSWDDLLKHKLIVGTMAPGTTTYVFPMLLKNLFGAQFELVSGYPDSSAAILALEHGEVQSICQTYSSLRSLHAQWFKDGQIVPLVLLGLKRNPDLPDVPAVTELATSDEQKRVLTVILAPTLAGRPFFAPPGVPQDRLAALRAAFDSTMKDAAFLEEAAHLKLEVKPASGQEIETLIGQIYATPPALIAKARAIVAKK